MSRPAVVQFQSSSAFLRSYFQFLQALEPGFTVRRWSTRMELSSPKLLVEVLSGKRALKLKDLNLVLKGLELSSAEISYFEASILWENARSVTEKKVLQSALDSMAQGLSTKTSVENQKTAFEAEDDELFSHWVALSGLDPPRSWTVFRGRSERLRLFEQGRTPGDRVFGHVYYCQRSIVLIASWR